MTPIPSEALPFPKGTKDGQFYGGLPKWLQAGAQSDQFQKARKPSLCSEASGKDGAAGQPECVTPSFEQTV